MSGTAAIFLDTMGLSGRHEGVDHRAACRRHLQELQTCLELVVTAISSISHLGERAPALAAAMQQDIEA
jgi:hypothetical protein